MPFGLPSAVLFACTHNAIRSPMAEGLLKHFHGQRVFVDSVGVHEEEVNGFAIAVMAEIGIDISTHRPKTFDEFDDAYVDVVISLSPEAQHKAVEMTRTLDCSVEFWHTMDATWVDGSREVQLDAFRQVRDELKARLLERFPLVE